MRPSAGQDKIDTIILQIVGWQAINPCLLHIPMCDSLVVRTRMQNFSLLFT